MVYEIHPRLNVFSLSSMYVTCVLEALHIFYRLQRAPESRIS